LLKKYTARDGSATFSDDCKLIYRYITQLNGSDVTIFWKRDVKNEDRSKFVSISFPLAYSISNNLGIEGYPFFLTIAYAASAAFLTPISYQTNLIIFGPGGYKFKDFFKIGLPVNVVYLTVALSIIVFRYREVLF